MWLLFLLGCRCGPVEAPVDAPSASHFGQFEALVDAAAKGDLPTAQFVARTLEEGEAGPLGDGADEVGGALGFVQIAEDTEELADGVGAAAAGCAGCHQQNGVTPPKLEAWSHQTAGRRLARAVAFGVAEAPAGSSAELVEVREAWESAEGADGDRLAAALLACAGCHKGE